MLTTLSFLLLLCVYLVVAQEAEKEKFKPSPRLRGIEKQVFPAGQDPALSTLSIQTDSQVHTVRTLLRYFKEFDEITSRVIQRSGSEDRPQSDNEITTCNIGRNQGTWWDDLTAHMGLRGFEPPDTGCQTEMNETPDNSSISSSDVYDAVFNRAQHIADVARPVADRLGYVWANAATRGTNFQHNIRTQRCTFNFAAAIFVDSTWNLVSSITNANKSATLPEMQRETVFEYTHIIDGNPRNALMQIAQPGSDEIETNLTTMLFKSDGVESTGTFENILPENNPAIIASLREGEHQVQQAADATTPSNIAILALPLAMNLVPVALIADVNTIGMLVYALLTDVLTAVPLAIKGIEVLSIGFQRERSVITRMTGADLITLVEPLGNETKGAEIFIAECQATQDLKPIGATFLAVALIFMVGGVAAEYWARSYVRRKRWGTKVVSEDGWEGTDSEPGLGSGPISSPSSGGTPLGPPQAAGLILARSSLMPEDSQSVRNVSRWGNGGSAGVGAGGHSAARGARRSIGKERERELAERSLVMERLDGASSSTSPRRDVSISGIEGRWNGPDGYDEKLE